jgi:hypothetical protein
VEWRISIVVEGVERGASGEEKSTQLNICIGVDGYAARSIFE